MEEDWIIIIMENIVDLKDEGYQEVIEEDIGQERDREG